MKEFIPNVEEGHREVDEAVKDDWSGPRSLILQARTKAKEADHTYRKSEKCHMSEGRITYPGRT